jgi:hypothetical protein
MNGSYRLAWQSGQCALFAELSLQCDWVTRPGLEMNVLSDVPYAWQVGLRFGGEVFAQAVLWRERGRGLSVRVESLRGQPSDTTVCAVAYATFQALRAATGNGESDAFRFDVSTGQFTLRPCI